MILSKRSVNELKKRNLAHLGRSLKNPVGRATASLWVTNGVVPDTYIKELSNLAGMTFIRKK